MDKTVIKNIIIISLVLGLILGIAAAIPYVGIIGLTGVMLFAAPLTMVYLIMAGKLDLTTTKDSIINGAIAGFGANLTFALMYSLIITIMFRVFNYSSNYFLSSIISNSPFWLLIVCIMFVGTLTATTNAFAGLATHYIINFIRDTYEKRVSK